MNFRKFLDVFRTFSRFSQHLNIRNIAMSRTISGQFMDKKILQNQDSFLTVSLQIPVVRNIAKSRVILFLSEKISVKNRTFFFYRAVIKFICGATNRPIGLIISSELNL